MSPYSLLALAIASEVIGTTALRASQGFTRLGPSVLVVLGYGSAFYLMALALRSLPLGFVYAVWSGVGTTLVALLGVLLFKDRLDAWAVVGIALIVAGVVVLNALSSATTHAR